MNGSANRTTTEVNFHGREKKSALLPSKRRSGMQSSMEVNSAFLGVGGKFLGNTVVSPGGGYLL